MGMCNGRKGYFIATEKNVRFFGCVAFRKFYVKSRFVPRTPFASIIYNYNSSRRGSVCSYVFFFFFHSRFLCSQFHSIIIIARWKWQRPRLRPRRGMDWLNGWGEANGHRRFWLWGNKSVNRLYVFSLRPSLPIIVHHRTEEKKKILRNERRNMKMEWYTSRSRAIEGVASKSVSTLTLISVRAKNGRRMEKKMRITRSLTIRTRVTTLTHEFSSQ